MLKTSESISVIVGTNRPNNLSSKVAERIVTMLEEEGRIVNYFSLCDLPKGFPEDDLYGSRTLPFRQIMETHIERFEKILFVIPEYNASFPGVFKSFIDAMPKETLQDKRIALVGTSTGRGGNSRGIDHLTNIFHYLGVRVFHEKMLISSLLRILEGNKITDPGIETALKNFLKRFITF